MIFNLSPTGYELARAKQAAMTPARRKQEGRGQLKKAIRRAAIRGITAGSQYVELLAARRICAEYGIEEPVIVKWFILLHGATL